MIKSSAASLRPGIYRCDFAIFTDETDGSSHTHADCTVDGNEVGIIFTDVRKRTRANSQSAV